MVGSVEGLIKEPYVRLRHGNIVHFLNPKPEQIKIDDIAWHLARTCRFNGAMKYWYSNAEHCIQGMRQAPSRDVARAFLIHDAGEYVFGDLASPVKEMFPDYKEASDKFQDYLYQHFLGFIPLHGPIKEIDRRICSTEMKYLRHQKQKDTWAEPYNDVHFHCWEWKEAYQRYLDIFQWYFPEYKDVEVVLGNAASE